MCTCLSYSCACVEHTAVSCSRACKGCAWLPAAPQRSHKPPLLQSPTPLPPQAPAGRGGGVFLSNAAAQLSAATVSSNAASTGGGVYVTSTQTGPAFVFDAGGISYFENNTAAGDGGGLYFGDARARVQYRCVGAWLQLPRMLCYRTGSCLQEVSTVLYSCMGRCLAAAARRKPGTSKRMRWGDTTASEQPCPLESSQLRAPQQGGAVGRRPLRNAQRRRAHKQRQRAEPRR